MRLELQGVSARVGAHTHLYPTSVSLMAGAINVLLGPTLAGKTTLMRLMAGLDRPTEGKIIADATVADAILDRLVHNAYRLELKGESMRKSKLPPVAYVS